MPVDVRMPLLGDVMKEGRLLEWLKPDGAWIEQGEPLFAIETDKTTYSVEAPAAGRVEHRARAGDVIPVNGTLGVLWGRDERASSGAERAPASDVVATPAAKRLAREHGIALTGVAGTGPGGRITEDDVQAHLRRQTRTEESLGGGAPTGTAGSTILPLRGRRKVIADRMHASLRDAAQLTIGREVDATRIVEFRSRHLETWQAAASVRVTYTDIITKAAALALRGHPLLNARVVGGDVHLHGEINIALAVHDDEGLMVPVLPAADRRPLVELARAARALAERARSGRLTREEAESGTFTVSSMGAHEVDWFTPIINPPQVAILGIGRIVTRPALADGRCIERQVISLCLTFDHRALDGVPAARFLARVAALLQEPEALL